MATVTNVTPRTPLSVPGVPRKLVQPGESAETPRKEGDLRKHPFVRSGKLVIGDATKSSETGNASGARQIVEQIQDETDQSRLEELSQDSRKTVANAAAARLQTLADEGGEGGEGGEE